MAGAAHPVRDDVIDAQTAGSPSRDSRVLSRDGDPDDANIVPQLSDPEHEMTVVAPGYEIGRHGMVYDGIFADFAIGAPGNAIEGAAADRRRPRGDRGVGGFRPRPFYATRPPLRPTPRSSGSASRDHRP